MQTIPAAQLLFYIWWVLINSVLYYAEIDFLLYFSGSREKKQIPLYVIINAVLTAAAIWTQLFSLFSVLHIALLFLFSAKRLKIAPKLVIAPAVIFFTLSTFREGFVAVFMQFLSSTLTSRCWGMFFQFALPAALAGLFLLALRLIVKRYPLMNRSPGSSCLYVLLLPSALLIWGIRASLGLDGGAGEFSHGALVGGEWTSVVYATLWMAGALLVFFVMIEVFHKITVLSQQETERALLASEIKEQRGYIDEARQRNEGYRSFQHDINNHLLVLSGLLHAKEYRQAEGYLQKLNTAADGLSEDTSTGNSVLDVLLWEKIRYAKKSGISVVCDVQIPKNSAIDDIDLCVLFANGMDNAIEASMNADLKGRSITLTAKPKRSFLLIDMVNGVNCPKPVVYGTGLKNMELTAKKYAGAVHTEQRGNQFSLSILLCFQPAAKDAEPLT